MPVSSDLVPCPCLKYRDAQLNYSACRATNTHTQTNTNTKTNTYNIQIIACLKYRYAQLNSSACRVTRTEIQIQKNTNTNTNTYKIQQTNTIGKELREGVKKCLWSVWGG